MGRTTSCLFRPKVGPTKSARAKPTRIDILQGEIQGFDVARHHLTYKEALASPEFSLWDRQRLRDARREVNGQPLAIFGCEGPVAASIGANQVRGQTREPVDKSRLSVTLYKRSGFAADPAFALVELNRLVLARWLLAGAVIGVVSCTGGFVAGRSSATCRTWTRTPAARSGKPEPDPWPMPSMRGWRPTG